MTTNRTDSGRGTHGTLYRAVSIVCFLAFLSLVHSQSGSSEICRLSGCKAGAVSFTTDDGFIESVRKYVAYFREYNVRGTVALVADWVNPGASGVINDSENLDEDHGLWPEWKAMADEGYLEIANHTYNHPELDRLSGQTLDYEVNGARERINSFITGHSVNTLVFPYCQVSATARAKVAEQHIAARGEDGGTNSLTPGDFYNLKGMGIWQGHYDYVPDMNRLVDEAITNNQWMIEMWHGCDGVGWMPVPCDDLKQHIAYTASRRNDVFIGSMGDVAKYIKERMSASAGVVSANDKQIQLSLNDGLDNAIFDYPLTLKTEVPATWLAAGVTQANSAMVVSNTFQENGKYYVLVDAVPDRGTITLVPTMPGIRSQVAGNRIASHAPVVSLAGKGMLRMLLRKGDAATAVWVYSAHGELVQKLCVESSRAEWDLRDANGKRASRGLYALVVKGAKGTVGASRVAVID